VFLNNCKKWSHVFPPKNGGGEDLPGSDDEIYRYVLSKLYYPIPRRTISENLIKVGS